jgi:hypothetical protein
VARENVAEQRQEGDAVEFDAGRGRDAGGFEEGGDDVDVGGDAVHIRAGGGAEAGGPADEAGDADAAVVGGALEAAQAGVEARVLRAVVGEEDHDRVPVELQLFEPGQDAADVVVDVGNHRIDAGDPVGVQLLRQGPAGGRKAGGAQIHRLVAFVMLLRHVGQRVVRRVEGQVGEERPVAVGGDEIDR